MVIVIRYLIFNFNLVLIIIIIKKVFVGQLLIIGFLQFLNLFPTLPNCLLLLNNQEGFIGCFEEMYSNLIILPQVIDFLTLPDPAIKLISLYQFSFISAS